MNDKLNIPVDAAGFSARTANSLKNIDCVTLGDVIKITENDLKFIPNFGKKSFFDLKVVLQYHGLSLAEQKIMLTAWNPIETAPENVWVLVCDEDKKLHVFQMEKDEDGYMCWQESTGFWILPNNNEIAITHWMPLPNPPKEM